MNEGRRSHDQGSSRIHQETSEKDAFHVYVCVVCMSGLLVLIGVAILGVCRELG